MTYDKGIGKDFTVISQRLPNDMMIQHIYETVTVVTITASVTVDNHKPSVFRIWLILKLVSLAMMVAGMPYNAKPTTSIKIS